MNFNSNLNYFMGTQKSFWNSSTRLVYVVTIVMTMVIIIIRINLLDHSRTWGPRVVFV